MEGTRARRLCRSTRGRSACCSRTSRPSSSRRTWNGSWRLPSAISVQICPARLSPRASPTRCGSWGWAAIPQGIRSLCPAASGSGWPSLRCSGHAPPRWRWTIPRPIRTRLAGGPPTGFSGKSASPEPGAPVVIGAGAVEFVYPSCGCGGGPAPGHVDLTVRQGEGIAIVAANGSGKTSLAKLSKGLLVPTRGEVRIHGEDTRRMTAGRLASMVGYVFQNPDHQIFANTVSEEIAFGPRNLGVPADDIPGRVREALEAVGLDLPGIADADPFSLTKGDRQRVAVASVLATRPDILIFDEPTTGLDYREIRGMMALIRQLNQAGHTIVMITHLMWVAAEYAARCVVLQAGGAVGGGPTPTRALRRARRGGLGALRALRPT